MAELILFDTTLRDGEQSHEFNPDFEQRLEIALALDSAGIDIIELASSEDDGKRLEQSARIAAQLKHARACCLSLIDEAAIEIAHNAFADVARSRVHLYLDAKRVHAMAVSDADREAALSVVARGIKYAGDRFDEVQFSPQDASRAEVESLKALATVAVDAGATGFSIADTVGSAAPELIAGLFDEVRESLPAADETVLAIHAHNHLGNAVDNVITAFDHGMRQVEGTLGGIGPSGGNTDLLEVLMRIDQQKLRQKPVNPDLLRGLV